MSFPLPLRRALTAALALSFIGAPLSAQTPGKNTARAAPAKIATVAVPAAAPRPWLYEKSDVPIDKAWHFGVLPNGLRYAVRRNDVPAGQVSIRVRVDVGSLMEEPDEAGFAHFIEHLTFRGSRVVPVG